MTGATAHKALCNAKDTGIYQGKTSESQWPASAMYATDIENSLCLLHKNYSSALIAPHDNRPARWLLRHRAAGKSADQLGCCVPWSLIFYTMLDSFCIFTKGGALLWTIQLAALRGDPVNALIRTCLLEEHWAKAVSHTRRLLAARTQ